MDKMNFGKINFGKINFKYKNLSKAFKSFQDALSFFEKIKDSPNKEFLAELEYEDVYLAARDSLIQRFEYTIDLFWKYLKFYLENEGVASDIGGPNDVIRKAYNISLIGENQAEEILEMIKNRNKTSHIYKEEIADYLIRLIPGYYSVLNDVLHKIVPSDSH